MSLPAPTAYALVTPSSSGPSGEIATVAICAVGEEADLRRLARWHRLAVWPIAGADVRWLDERRVVEVDGQPAVGGLWGRLPLSPRQPPHRKHITLPALQSPEARPVGVLWADGCRCRRGAW